jgi:AraC-like DNA-binding protein
VRPADVLRRAGLPDDALARSVVRLSTAEYFRLWEGIEAEVGDPLFPLRLAEMVTAESFSPPVFAALCSPNLAVALERIARYKRLVCPMALDVDAAREAVSLTLRWLDAATPVPRSLVGMEMAFFVRLARLATREHVRPLRVVTPAPLRPAAAYERFFGIGVRQGQTHTLVFARADAERPFLTANDAVWKLFEPELRRRLAELDDSAGIEERVRAALLEALPGGQASMDAVAARLGLSRRTLQRRLGEQATSFQAIVRRTREGLARHYLTRTRLPHSEISFLLGYDDPNSFFRAFHGWTGQTPEAARRELSPREAGSPAPASRSSRWRPAGRPACR